MKVISAVLFWLVPMLLLFNPVSGQSVSFPKQLSAQLSDRSKLAQLYYPESVKRYYAQNGYQPVWIKNKDQNSHVWEAMILLDCVIQYGLAHADYHPDGLTYEHLPAMIDEPEKISVEEKATFEILLTDALITLINHLHYGKLNRVFTAAKIDKAKKITGFDASALLAKANEQRDFTTALLTAQPKSKAYVALQSYMKLIKGQYVGDCYEVPESEVRKIAINMERLRWWEFDGKEPRQKKAPYLTCEIKDGLPVFYKDTRHLDGAMEAAMYNNGKSLPSKKKPPIPLPDIQMKKN